MRKKVLDFFYSEILPHCQDLSELKFSLCIIRHVTFASKDEFSMTMAFIKKTSGLSDEEVERGVNLSSRKKWITVLKASPGKASFLFKIEIPEKKAAFDHDHNIDQLNNNNKIQIDQIYDQLIIRGISPKASESLSIKYPAEYIRKKIRLFDRILEKNRKDIFNPGGFLRKCIEEDYEITFDDYEEEEEIVVPDKPVLRRECAIRKENLFSIKRRIHPEEMKEYREEAKRRMEKDLGKRYSEGLEEILEAYLNILIAERAGYDLAA